MKVSAVAETLTVTGQSPVVDTVHGGTSSNFNAELVSNIAVSRVSFFDVPALAPGVQVTNSSIGTSSGFNINGSDSNQNAFQYDGLDVSAPSFGGPFDWPNFDMMQEMQVKAVGASAEYAGFQGGVINLVLKSGSNQFKGSASFYGIWDPLQGNNTPWEEFPRKTDYRLDYNYSFGGPIVKDKLWFQYIAEHIRWELSDGLGVPPDAMDKTRIWRPFIKVDAHPTEKDSFSVHYNDCRDWWGYGAGKLIPPIAASVEIGIDPVVTAQWNHIFNSTTLLDVKGGGVYINKDYVPQQGDLVTPGHWDILTGAASVNRPYANIRDLENRQNINATLSHTATDFIKGTHEFKFGVQTTPWNTSTIRGGYASGKLFYDLGTAPYYALNQEPYAQGGTIKMYGVFVQDDWTFNRATIGSGYPGRLHQRFRAVSGAARQHPGANGKDISGSAGRLPLQQRVATARRRDQAGRVREDGVERALGPLLQQDDRAAVPGHRTGEYDVQLFLLQRDDREIRHSVRIRSTRRRTTGSTRTSRTSGSTSTSSGLNDSCSRTSASTCRSWRRRRTTSSASRMSAARTSKSRSKTPSTAAPRR